MKKVKKTPTNVQKVTINHFNEIIKAQLMKKNELLDVLHDKNNILIQQTRRIKLLEDKLTELRLKYFKLKYSDVSLH